MENVGVKSIGIKCPIIRESDNLIEIIYESIKKAGVQLQDDDVIGITESIVARAQGNYATIDDIVRFLIDKKFSRNLVLHNPIMSRNRFSMILKGFARFADNISIMFTYRRELDEQGNPIYVPNPFTGVDILQYYREICESESCKFRVNELGLLLSEGRECYDIIDCSCHPVKDTKVKSLADILNEPVSSEYGTSGWNADWGLLGSNKANEETIKLFPRKNESQILVDTLRDAIYSELGVRVHVMVYGDGCFHSPAIEGLFGSSIWEFADPVTTPAFTDGLNGTPNEIKIKAFADDKYKDLSGEELDNAIRKEIEDNKKDLHGQMTSQGTTPRKFTDLLASLMDLTSGSGDKGTPVVVVQNYFKKY